MKTTRRLDGAIRRQIAALPVRIGPDGVQECMLVTSRETKRWIVPKGWPMKGLKDHEAAAREAFEEAGVVGKVRSKPYGRYTYWKRFADHFAFCEVKLYRLDVEKELDIWPEQGQRSRRWFRWQDAAALNDEPGIGPAITLLCEGAAA